MFRKPFLHPGGLPINENFMTWVKPAHFPYKPVDAKSIAAQAAVMPGNVRPTWHEKYILKRSSDCQELIFI